MKKLLKAISLTLFVCFAMPAQAETMAPDGAPTSKDLKQVLDRLQSHYRDTNSFSAKFSEQVTTVGAPAKNRSGTVSFRKPGRMRWDFEQPEKQTIVSDGTTLYSYDPDLNQVVQTPLKQAIKSSDATAFLLGMGNINRDFKAAFAKPPAPGEPIDLALDAKSGGYKVEIGVDPKSYDIASLTLTDQLGDVTKIEFSDIHNNVELADSLFAFKVPAGADIVSAPSAP